MNPLYVDSQRVGLGVDGYSLYIKDLKNNKIIEKFEPRNIPYDSIFIQRPNGFISFGALNYCIQHAISLVLLNWRGNVLAEFLPEEPLSPDLKIAHVQSYLDRSKHLFIAKRLVETKLNRQSEFISSLRKNYPFVEIPRVEMKNSTSETFIRASEAEYAIKYFQEYSKVCNSLGYEVKARTKAKAHNMHASDLTNALLNYSYALLKVAVRRALNSIGLDNSIPFVHDLRDNQGLVYDLMEFWRSNCDYAVLQTLELLKKKKSHYLSDNFEVLLRSDTVKLLFERVKMNLSLEEIILNCRILARFMLDNRPLTFKLRSIEVRPLFETERVKELILSKSARQLQMPKATLWYQKKKLRDTGSLRLYNVSKHYFTNT